MPTLNPMSLATFFPTGPSLVLSTSINVGNVTSRQLDLTAGQRYYFVVQACDNVGQVSPRSAETFADVVGPPAPPSITSVSPTAGDRHLSHDQRRNFGATQGTSSVQFNGTTAVDQWALPASSRPCRTRDHRAGGRYRRRRREQWRHLHRHHRLRVARAVAVAGCGHSCRRRQATYASGTFSVAGAGAGIWAPPISSASSPDLTGDGEIVARVGSLQNTDMWAKAGVMIREDLAGNAPNAATFVTATRRPISGAAREGQQRLRRGFGGARPMGAAGAHRQHLRGYYSANGSAWTLMMTCTVTMPAQVYIGLAVTSHNASVAASATFSNVTVTGSGGAPPNQAPTLTQPANQATPEGSNVSLALVASDPEGNTLTYSATGLPASLTVAPATGVISGTLTFTSAGTYSVTATVSDGSLSNSKTFTWTVTDVAQGPTLTSLSPTTGAVGTSVTISGTNFGSTQARARGSAAPPRPRPVGRFQHRAAVPSGAPPGRWSSPSAAPRATASPSPSPPLPGCRAVVVAGCGHSHRRGTGHLRVRDFLGRRRRRRHLGHGHQFPLRLPDPHG